MRVVEQEPNMMVNEKVSLFVYQNQIAGSVWRKKRGLVNFIYEDAPYNIPYTVLDLLESLFSKTRAKIFPVYIRRDYKKYISRYRVEI